MLNLFKDEVIFFFQSLFTLTPGQYRGFIRFFQTFASEGELTKHDLRAILFKYDVIPTNDELQDMIDSLSVDCKYFILSKDALIKVICSYLKSQTV